MKNAVKAAFEMTTVLIPIGSILPLRQITAAQRKSTKYRRIASSIAEVGIIEPPVVARSRDSKDLFLLLEGHIRVAILTELGEQMVNCLISDDDEAFTYNKRVNRLATVQEHYMIMRALQRGVSEEKLAKALNVEINAIKRRMNLLDGISPEVVDLFKDKAVNPATFETMQRMKSARQVEVAELMLAAGNFTASYARALFAATKPHDLVNPERGKRLKGITSEQMARMEREMETLQRDFKAVEASYGDDILHLVVASGYISKLISNLEVERYLSIRFPEFLTEFRSIINAASLDQSAPASN